MSDLFNQVLNGNMSIREEVAEESVDENNNDYGYFTEASFPDVIPYLKMTHRMITLPKGTPVGKGNLCFLYTNNTEESKDLMTNKINFVNGNHYYFYFYNLFYQGKLYGKRYRERDLEGRNKLYKDIKKTTPIHPYIPPVVDLLETRNMYFDLSKYVEIFNLMCYKLPPSKKIQSYWNFMKSIYNGSTIKHYNRFVLIDISKFTLGKELKENLKNPLFMLYYSMFRYLDQVKDIDMDFYFFYEKRCIKVNPSLADKKTYLQLMAEMKRLYRFVPKTDMKTLDETVNEENIVKSELVDESIGRINDKINANKTDEVIDITKMKEENQTTPFIKDGEIVDKIEKKAEKVKGLMNDIAPTNLDIPTDEMRGLVSKKVEEEIDSDKELLDQIYKSTVSKQKPKSAFSSARDEQLRKEQENIKMGNLTIGELEKIKANKFTVPVTDVSTSVRTTNENMKKLKFKNFNKSYINELMPKDIADAIMSLNNKSLPLFIRDIKIQDTSDELNYKDTYTIQLEDANRQRQTIKVDIPKFYDDKFLYLGGNEKIIKNQNILYPVIKTGEHTVQIITSHNKMFIERVDTKSIASVEKLKKLVKSNDVLKDAFIFGNAYIGNSKSITTLEYDELGKMLAKFKIGKCEIFFSQSDVKEKFKEEPKKNQILIGTDKDGNKIYIDTETQTTKDGRTIVEVMLDACPDEVKAEYLSIKVPKRLMYTNVKIMGQYVSLALLICFWEGISKVLKKMNLDYRLEESIPKELGSNEMYIKFADCVMVYKETVPVALLMNGIRILDTDLYTIAEMDTMEPYINYFTKVYGKANISNALYNTYEFMIDPIQKEVLETLNLPTEIVSLIIYAVSLLADDQFVGELNQGVGRIRNAEIIPGILYDKLSKAYTIYRNSNGRKKFSVKQDCVIKDVLALKTVEELSTLNPMLEMEMLHGVSNKGFRGINLDEAYSMDKRMFDKTSTGVVAPSSSPDKNVGVSKTLTMEPSINSLRGYVDLKDDKLNELKDVNLFSPAELTMPLSATHDDPTRLGHAIKQSRHVIPVKDSAPVLISNGVEEVLRYDLSSHFAINADEDGKIVDYNEELGIMIAQYKSGKCRAINLNHDMVKNGGGGFYLSSTLKTDLIVGSSFKKNDVLAYHREFFTNDKFNNCRLNMGTMIKVAILSTYNTYQDATFITENMSERCATEMCFARQISIGKNSNVEYIVKKGQEIAVGESLLRFDTSYEDDSLNALLANLSDVEKKDTLADSRNDIASKISGVIEDIKMYSTVDLEEMSPSLRKIFKAYYKEINAKKEFLEKYDPDSKDSIVKCGVLFKDTTKKIEPNKFGVIKGQNVEDAVLIEIYIKHSEPLEVGSKIANFTGLKNTVGEIIPRGYEPYSESNPDEEISEFIASNSILKRMVPSLTTTVLGNKMIIGLKEKLREIYEK